MYKIYSSQSAQGANLSLLHFMKFVLYVYFFLPILFFCNILSFATSWVLYMLSFVTCWFLRLSTMFGYCTVTCWGLFLVPCLYHFRFLLHVGFIYHFTVGFCNILVFCNMLGYCNMFSKHGTVKSCLTLSSSSFMRLNFALFS